MVHTATIATWETTGSKSSQRGKGEKGPIGEGAKEPRPNTPSGFNEYPNPIQEVKENLVKAKALVEECQAMQVEPVKNEGER